MPTYAGRLTSGKLPPSTSVRVVDPTGGPNSNTPADATLYETRTYTGSVANPVTTTSEGDLPEVYVAPGSYELVFGSSRRAAEAKLDAAEDDATEFETVAEAEAKTAADLPYDNTTSGLTASDVQAAIDELTARVIDLETP